jgi:hypothetical protein
MQRRQALQKFIKTKFSLILFSTLTSLGFSQTYSLQSWAELEDGVTIGNYQDDQGSQIEIERAEGPASEEDAIKISASIKQWGGVWSSCWDDLSDAKSIQFQAKADQPGLVIVQLHDEDKFRVTTTIKIENSEWQTFNLPISLFSKNLSYQEPSVKEDAVMDWTSVQILSFDWAGNTNSSFYFGPIRVTSDDSTPITGLTTPEGKLIVQDYAMFSDKNGGLFKDEYGSVISMNIEQDKDSQNGFVASFMYDLLSDGYCGAWAESGYLWQGQNWQGAKELEMRVYSEESLEIELAFNDKNQNAYVAPPAQTNGIGWETISVNFNDFYLNEYYQPDDATPGADLDLSHIKNFNLSPKTPGEYRFKVDLVAVVK